MTVTYTHEVANARLGGFSNLLWRWRGSVYKLFYKEFIIYITLYVILSMTYRFVDNSYFRTYFEKLCLQFQSYTDLVPISFVLGFYVSMVVGRWWKQYEYIPWPDRLMVIISANVHGPDNRGRLIRRTLMRYLNLAQVLTYRSISTAVFKRFPTMQHVIDAGFMTPAEYKQYENLKTENVKYFIPCVWFTNLLSKVRQEGRIYDDMTYQAILKELNDFRGCCGMLFSYDWISIPLVYTQVVTVAVYVFFMSTLLSRQYLDVTKNYPGHEVDLYVPIFTICQFFFYVGWLKVAEQLINPFGEDDDDFEVNAIIDRNLELSMLTVDEMYLSHPKIEKDMYWNNPNPSIPYTAAAANHKLDAFLGSTVDMSLDRQDMQFVEHRQSPLAEREEYDVNHNEINHKQKLTHSPPVSGSPAKQRDFKSANSANFWKRFTGRDKESETKKNLLEMDFLSPRTKAGIKNEMIKEEVEDNIPTTEPEDSSESDVGDGGRSEDEESDDNRTHRRSSLSSEEGQKEDKDAPTDSKNSLGIRKHSIEEPADRPQAKKPKNNPNITTNQTKLPPTKNNSADKPRRPNALISNVSEASLKSMGTRLTIGRRKSPKKRTSAQKLTKWNDFPRKVVGEMEEERKNAQTRTIGLLKASSHKKKSVQALQRNARRVNYPGNAWLRHKYPPPWKSDIMSTGDYASMTSGAEDQGRHDNDSIFGSIISFGTSIPSPRPLRFSQFGKLGKRRHCDSASVSSCMTSPCANDDLSPFAGFSNHSPRCREDQYFHTAPPYTNPISMPFTEDLRRRLLVVNANTPNSSSATSPVVSRHAQPLNHHQIPVMLDSDDLLMIAPDIRAGDVGPLGATLESIGEVAASEKPSKSQKPDCVSDIVQNKHDQPEKEENLNNPPNATDPKTESKPPDERRAPVFAINGRKDLTILRSKSCSDVPISKMYNPPKTLEDPEDETKPNEHVKSRAEENEGFPIEDSRSVNNLKTDPENLETPCQKDESPIHCDAVAEDSADKLKKNDSEEEEEGRDFDTSYMDLTRYRSDELTPLLQGTDDELERTFEKLSSETNVSLEVETQKPNMECDPTPNHTSNIPNIPASPRLPWKKPPLSVVSDLGYCSSKEDSETNASAKANDALSKIHNITTSTPSRNSVDAVFESIRKLNNETPSKSSESKTDNQIQHSTVPEAVVIPMSSSDDVVIEIS